MARSMLAVAACSMLPAAVGAAPPALSQSLPRAMLQEVVQEAAVQRVLERWLRTWGAAGQGVWHCACRMVQSQEAAQTHRRPAFPGHLCCRCSSCSFSCSSSSSWPAAAPAAVAGPGQTQAAAQHAQQVGSCLVVRLARGQSPPQGPPQCLDQLQWCRQWYPQKGGSQLERECCVLLSCLPCLAGLPPGSSGGQLTYSRGQPPCSKQVRAT